MKELSENNLAATVGKNTIYGIAASLTWVGVRMIVVPIIISYLGIEGYGIWAIIMAVMAYMQLGVAGVSSAFQKYVAEATVTGDHARASILLSTGFILIVTAYFVGLIPVIIFARNLAQALGVPQQFIADTANSFILLVFAVNISNIGGAYQSIIMGAHRIDIVKKVDLLLIAVETGAILLLLVNGYGLFAMTIVILVSQICRTVYYYFKSHRVLPQLQIKPGLFSRSVLGELVRFAGSFQILNIFAVLYLNILPLAILKLFGAKAAGIFAVCVRIVESATFAPEALLLPLLSGGTFINYHVKLSERMGLLFQKSLKATTTMALPLLAFIMVFGEKIIFAWTGQQNELIFWGIICLCMTQFFRSIAKVSFVLYRTTGGTTKDVVWQFLRFFILILAIGLGGKGLTFYGVLVGAVVAEFIGMLFMVSAIKLEIKDHYFKLKPYFNDTARLTAIIVTILTGCFALTVIPLPFEIIDRIMVTIKLCVAFGVFTLLAISTLWVTGYLSSEERQMVTRSFMLLFR